MKEDETGLPFVGLSGELLDEWIHYLGLAQDQVYITNIVQCHTPKNRGPTQEEMDACNVWLIEKVKLVRPELVVTLGVDAHRIWDAMTWNFGELKLQIPHFALKHPSYYLRMGSKGWEDELEHLRMRLYDLGLV